MDLALVMFTDKGERRDFPITKSKSVIGRTGECDLQIPLDNVSRRHCELTVKNGKVAVRDLGSSNGTYVNKKRIQQAEIKAGQKLIVGPVIFTVVIDGEPEEIKPVRSIVQPKKEKSDTAAPRTSDDTGSLDLAEAAELKIDDGPDRSGSSMPAELEELSKQHKKKR